MTGTSFDTSGVGLVMGTRAGSVDPGVLLAAQREHHLDASVGPFIDEPASGDRVIAYGPVAVLVVEAREDAVIAREVRALA